MSLSIRWRLTLWIMGSLVVALVAVYVIVDFALRETLTSDIDDDLTQGVDQVSALLVIRGSPSDVTQVQEVVDRYSVGGLSSGFVVLVRDTQGGHVASTAGIDPEEFALAESEVERVLAGDVVSRNLDISGGEEVRVRSSPLTIGDETIGIVQVGESRALVTRTLDRFRTLFGAVAGAAVLVAVAVAYWLSRRALRPIENVAAVAARIEASDLSERIGARDQPAEVQRLSETFDAMLDRLDDAFQQQHNFVLDVAHELRTPLTALRGNIDVVLMSEELSPELRGQLERMSAETSRLIRLTSNLLYLALADSGFELDRRPVELDVVCLEVHRLLRQLRPEVKLRLGNEDQATVQGDRDLLKQAILNLVENGLKYTPSGGEVTLSLYREPSAARIVIRDTGRGLSAEELPHIFERFYRGRGGETKRRGSGGAGIGLALVDWIVRAHGGEIRVESEPGKGSTFAVRLPMTPVEERAALDSAEPSPSPAPQPGGQPARSESS